MLDHVKVDLLPPVMVNGEPGEAAMQDLDRLADEILKKHKEVNIV
jgi:hypothetical protein